MFARVELPLALMGLVLAASPTASVTPAVLWAADSGVARESHGAALLPDGKVLVEGPPPFAQRYDPASNAWLDGGISNDGHAIYSLARLRNGTLIAVDNGNPYEWWSPQEMVWSYGPSGAHRQNGVAILLSSGQLLTGCGDDGDDAVGHFELLDQAAGDWLDAGDQIAPAGHCAISPLPGDRWLKTGGDDASSVAEIWSADGGGRPL